MLLMLSIAAGAGLFWLRTVTKLKKGIVNSSFISNRLGIASGLVLAVIILAIAIPEHVTTHYYKMIDKTDFESFTWIKNNIAPDSKITLLDPWKATACTAITQKYSIHRIFE